MTPRRIAILILVAAGSAHTQPAFEVASIKPSGEKSVRDSGGGPGSSDPGQYHYNMATLQDLIAVAYDVEYFQISSKAPLDREHFDLVAKVPASATKPQFRAMMQSLLAERFRLKLHTQSKDFPAYELLVAKTGAKLKEGAPASPSSPDDGFPDLPPDRPGFVKNYSARGGFTLVRMRARQQPISALARMLRSLDEPPIVDRTGLTGKYDFTLEYSTERNGASTDTLPPAASLFTALQQQLGLQLVSKKVPFDVLIVDSVDKMPTEN